MSKIVVLAEKPSVGRDLARVLQCNIKGNGYLEGPKYIVTWALGHLVTLADPEAYDEKYKAWRLEDLPMLPPELKLVVIKQTGKQFSAVKEQLSRKDVSEVVIATDAGREGELVARWILEKAHINKPVKRLWISSVTDKAIRDGFSSLKPGKEYENLYASAVARSESDWLVGINATRALTTKYNAQLSCGRVQTPTLAIIAGREAEIKNFQPRTYYGITATAERLKLTWQEAKSKESRTFEKVVCDKIITAITGKKAEVIDVHKVSKKAFSPALYDLTELQRDANKMFGFSAKETLSIMQKLYETHKALTYPRTDSRYLSTDIVETLKDRVKACDTGLYSRQILKILKAPIKAGSHFVDNGRVSDHHAIIPTEQAVVLNSLTDKEKKIYELVVRRFLAVLCPPFEYEETTVKAQIGNELFSAKGKTVSALGWRELYNNNLDEEEAADDHAVEQTLPHLNKGDILPINAIVLTKGETKPPALFTEASLLSAMENPAKYMSGESQALKQIIGQTGGLGTVATRADIIEKLFSSFVIEKKGKDILITSKGKQLLELAPSDLKSPALTAEWEQKLSAIAKGQLKKQAFIAEIKQYTQVIIREIKNSQEQFKHDNVTRTRCPECGKYLLEVNGKKGKSLVCQDRECGYRKNVAQVTNARCPNCHKKLELRGEGDARAFVCGCGYREKLAVFTERKKKEGDTKISKKDVSRYLKEQQEDKPINNALAEALAKLKLQ
ncbi:DNA topoisomerase III [Sporomusa sp.]|uniref:DNA topoisomerase III n=1 Tax=Sporomusa sp. TaxID=2078658 RepID=UPI002C2A4698|nr:DNA topoisomerase III [Sporomusa sp.]HWR08387.1 DNA topoisomerase III [Sporomusa sp.]